MAKNKTTGDFNPFDFCDKVYKTKDGKIVRHNARGMCDLATLKTWAEENPDLVEAMPEPSNEELLNAVYSNRKAAYVIESDPLRNEADFDAIKSGKKADYTAWVAKVEEIKARYPKP